jgi:hypothetical protein
MSKRKLATAVFTGLFLSAGAAHATSVFPSSTNEVSATGYAISMDGARDVRIGAMQPIFPSAAIEHGSVRESYVNAPAGLSRSFAEAASAFPSSSNETGRL